MKILRAAFLLSGAFNSTSLSTATQPHTSLWRSVTAERTQKRQKFSVDLLHFHTIFHAKYLLTRVVTKYSYHYFVVYCLRSRDSKSASSTCRSRSHRRQPPGASRDSQRKTPPCGSPAACPSGRSGRRRSAPGHGSPRPRRSPCRRAQRWTQPPPAPRPEQAPRPRPEPPAPHHHRSPPHGAPSSRRKTPPCGSPAACPSGRSDPRRSAPGHAWPHRRRSPYQRHSSAAAGTGQPSAASTQREGASSARGRDPAPERCP